MLNLNFSVGKLAFFAVSTESAIRLNPIFAHLCLVFGLVAPFAWRLIYIGLGINVLLAGAPTLPSVSVSLSRMIKISLVIIIC